MAKVEYLDAQDEAALMRQIVDADVLIPGWRVPITARVIAAWEKLKMIQTFSVGYDRIESHDFRFDLMANQGSI